MSELPVLDMAAFIDEPESAGGQQFVGDLLAAAHGPGFVYLTGHGIDPALDSDLFEVSREFFALPVAEREAIAIEHSAAFRGYTVLGDERTNGRADWRHQLDLGLEQEVPDLSAPHPTWMRMRGPNQWPASHPRMAPAVMSWMDAMNGVGLAALRALALGLGQSIDHFDDGFVPTSDLHLKIIEYPAPPGDVAFDDAGRGQGVGLHADTGLLTFILQDDVGGLQVELDGELVDAPPIEGAYLMNLGEMLQTATNGYLRATPHRVQSPPPGRTRMSIALFYNPRFELTFEPIDLPAALAAEAPGLSSVVDPDFSTQFGENNLKTRLRSHPDVARRHYADVN